MDTKKNFTYQFVNSGTIPATRRANFWQYLAAAGIFILVLAILALTAVSAYALLPAKVHYHIKKTFQVSQDSGDTNIYLGLMLPKSGPYQTIHNVSIQWDGGQDIQSRAYVDLLKLSRHLPGNSQTTAVVEYDVTLRQGKTAWQAPIEQVTLLPEKGIESNHELIKQTADQITSVPNGNQAFRIFQFTANFLKYSETGCDETNVSALEAFNTRVGACIGYSRLMVALSRAAGIPARMVIGTILPDILFSLPQVNTTGIPGSGHAWVEYNAQNSWHLADPSCGRGYTSYLSFDRSNGQHLSFGDFNQFINSKDELYDWATQYASAQEIQLTSVFASKSEQTEISSETTIRKIWDFRWVNTTLALVAVAFVLSKLSDRVMKRYPPN